MKKILIFFCLLITYTHFAQTDTEVFLFDLNYKKDSFELVNFKNVSNTVGYDNQPSFADSNTLLYAGYRNEQTDIVSYTISTDSKTWISSTEGSEYSPAKMPNEDAVSAIRLDRDGKQLLYKYSIKNGENSALMDTLIVGYHNWYEPDIIMSSVLEDDSMSLYLTHLQDNFSRKLQTNVGRSIHKIPNSNLMSFISKESENLWKIKSIHPLTGDTKTIIQTLPNMEDFCWTPAGSILMAKDGILYQFDPSTDDDWIKVANLNDFGIGEISRIAISPDSKKLAVVGELIPQTLEPKLENLKWISGNWKGEAFGGITEENWSEPSGGSMMATFKLIDKGQVVFYEIEIIREVENSLILQLKHFDSDLKGWETKDETVDFPLKEITTDKVVFEGMMFEKISNDEMNIYVDIKQENGEIEVVKFNYKK